MNTLIDHAKYLKEYVASGIPIITSNGTIEKLGFSFSGYRSGYWYQFGSFNITPFSAEHDCAEPFGFLIRHDDIGTMLFATDTQYIRYDFSNLRINHLMIECNYSEEIIKESSINDVLKNRIRKSHMELETCKEFILKNISPALDNVVLLHLSDGNSDERLFQREVSEIVGKGTKVFVADNGLTVDLNIRPW